MDEVRARAGSVRGKGVRVLSLPSYVFDVLVVDEDEHPDLGWLVELVEALPGLQRTVVEAVFWEGVTKVELAERLGVHRTSLDDVLTQALEALRTAVQAREVPAGSPDGRAVPVPLEGGAGPAAAG